MADINTLSDRIGPMLFCSTRDYLTISCMELFINKCLLAVITRCHNSIAVLVSMTRFDFSIYWTRSISLFSLIIILIKWLISNWKTLQNFLVKITAMTLSVLRTLVEWFHMLVLIRCFLWTCSLLLYVWVELNLTSQTAFSATKKLKGISFRREQTCNAGLCKDSPSFRVGTPCTIVLPALT